MNLPFYSYKISIVSNFFIDFIFSRKNSNDSVAAVAYRFFQNFLSFVIIFTNCELGERVNNGFVEVENAFDQLPWYLFPIEIWQMLPTIILAAKQVTALWWNLFFKLCFTSNVLIFKKQPITTEVFGKISCSREHFKKVG